MSLNEVADVLLLLALPPVILFIGFYGWRSPWRDLVAGRSLLYVLVALAAVLAQNAASVFIGSDYLGRELIRVVLYGGLVVTLWRMLWVLLHLQGKRKDTDAAADAAGGLGDLPGSMTRKARD